MGYIEEIVSKFYREESSNTQAAPKQAQSPSNIAKTNLAKDTLQSKVEIDKRPRESISKHHSTKSLDQISPSLLAASNKTRGSITISLGLGRRETENKEISSITINVRAEEEIEIPKDAREKLINWKSSKKFNPNSGSKRTPYTKTHISRAFKNFKDKYQCKWAIMKRDCRDKTTLQIINDLRSVYLEEIFQTLRLERKDLTISDFGSSNLTSDRDFAFCLGKDRQTEEATVAAKFNELFEAIWNAPSSIVFDSNAYTMEYMLKALDPKMEKGRCAIHQEGSLLQSCFINPKGWGHYKAGVMGKIQEAIKEGTLSEEAGNKALKKQKTQFEKIESRYVTYKQHLIQKMLDIATEGVETPRRRSELRSLVDQSNHFTDKESIDKFEESLQIRLGSNFNHVKILASNSLHIRYKSGYETLEKEYFDLIGRRELLGRFANNDDKQAAEEFFSLFNIEVNNLIYKIEKSISTTGIASEDKLSRIKQLEECLISNSNADRVYKAFGKRISLEEEGKKLRLQLNTLGNQANELDALILTKNRLTSQLRNSSKNTFTPNQIVESKNKNEAAINTLKKQLGLNQAITIRELKYQINIKIQEVEKNIKNCKANIEAAEKEYQEIWDIAGILSIECDRLLNEMQRRNIIGNLFAQEAHASGGAIGIIVFNLQANLGTQRTFDDCSQALNEVGSYYLEHQKQIETVQGKIVEASKYANRIIQISEFITAQVSRLNSLNTKNNRSNVERLTKPAFSTSLDLRKLKSFFIKVFALRGKGMSDEALLKAVTEAAKKVHLIKRNEKFSVETLNEINVKMQNFSIAAKVWIETVCPFELRSIEFTLKT